MVERSAICDLPDPAEAWRRHAAAEVAESLMRYAKGEKAPVPPASYLAAVSALFGGERPMPVPDPVPWVPPGELADMVIRGLTPGDGTPA